MVALDAPIQEQIDAALREGPSNESVVMARNRHGVNALMAGETLKSLNCFLDALHAAGSDPDLRAECLGNIGDFVRRINKDATLALAIFERAEQCAIESLITKSRLGSMRAMAWMLRTELGDHCQDEIDKAIDLLNETIGLAQQAQMTEPEKGLAAESFATHRLAGIICTYGNAKQKQDLAANTIPLFIHELDQQKHVAEIARLNYSRALCMVDTFPTTRPAATELLMQSARDIEPSSPVDACYYFAKAGEWYLEDGNVREARYCLERAQTHFGAAQAHGNAKRTIEQVEKLALLLSQ